MLTTPGIANHDFNPAEICSRSRELFDMELYPFSRLQLKPSFAMTLPCGRVAVVVGWSNGRSTRSEKILVQLELLLRRHKS